MCSSVNPIQFDPPWSPEEHLERVYRRGRQLRRRRQVGATGAALVAVVGLAVALSGSTSPLVHPLQVLTGTNHGSDSGAPAITTSTTTVDNNDSDIERHTTTTAASKNASTATTAGRTSGSNTTNSGDVTIINKGSEGGTPPSSPLSDCKSGDLKWITVTNRSSYKSGDTVEISLRARNISQTPCYSPSSCSASAWATVTDSNGKLVYQSAAHLVNCTKPATQPLLNPGDAHD